MEIIGLLLRQNTVMFIYLMIGYVLYRRGLITTKGSGEIGRFLLYVIMPMSIVRSYMQEYSREKLTALLLSAMMAVAAMLLSVFVGHVIFHKKQPIHQFCASFCNCGFFGIPLVQMTLGQEAVFYLASMVAVISIVQWTYGVYVMSGDRAAISARNVLLNPVLFAILAGLVLFLFRIQLPEILTGVIETLASMNGVLAMIVLGTYLAQLPLRQLFTDMPSYRCASVRLLLIPVLTALLLWPVPKKYAMIRLAVFLGAVTPSGANAAIFAQLYGLDYTETVRDICLSTLLSMLTIPLIVGFANMLW